MTTSRSRSQPAGAPGPASPPSCGARPGRGAGRQDPDREDDVDIARRLGVKLNRTGTRSRSPAMPSRRSRSPARKTRICRGRPRTASRAAAASWSSSACRRWPTGDETGDRDQRPRARGEPSARPARRAPWRSSRSRSTWTASEAGAAPGRTSPRGVAVAEPAHGLDGAGLRRRPRASCAGSRRRA